MSFMNNVKTTALMALLIGVMVVAFGFVGGRSFAIMGLFFGIVMNVGVFWYSDKVVLKMTRAHEVGREQAPELHAIVERVSSKAGIPKPRVYVIEDPSLNAFATGRGPGHAAVACHTGLLEALTNEEIEGVLAHEVSHIKNRDTLVSTVAAVIAGTLSYLSYALWFGDSRDRSPILAIAAAILAPIAGILIQMAISRTREYGADAAGARIADPRYLASALEKIQQGANYRPKRDGNPATAHMYIINPFTKVNFGSLFSTHPPTQERIRRLREMA